MRTSNFRTSQTLQISGILGKLWENSGKTLKISENGIGMNWCFHFQISTPKRCRTTGLSLGRRGPKQRAQVGGPFCQSTAKALAQCLPSNSALAKCRVEAALATIKGFSQLSLLGEETATIGQNESQQRDMVLQSICWCVYVHLHVMIWTRRTL